MNAMHIVMPGNWHSLNGNQRKAYVRSCGVQDRDSPAACHRLDQALVNGGARVTGQAVDMGVVAGEPMSRRAKLAFGAGAVLVAWCLWRRHRHLGAVETGVRADALDTGGKWEAFVEAPDGELVPVGVFENGQDAGIAAAQVAAAEDAPAAVVVSPTGAVVELAPDPDPVVEAVASIAGDPPPMIVAVETAPDMVSTLEGSAAAEEVAAGVEQIAPMVEIVEQVSETPAAVLEVPLGLMETLEMPAVENVAEDFGAEMVA